MTTLAIFVSTFAVVFFLGLQSLNVNRGHYAAAFLTSFAIGGMNLVILKTVPDGSLPDMLAYLLGGPFGILAAMWAHPRIVRRADTADISTLDDWTEPEDFGDQGGHPHVARPDTPHP